MLIVVYAPSCACTRCLVLPRFLPPKISSIQRATSPPFVVTTYLKNSSRPRMLSPVRAVIRQNDPRQKQEGET
jgi:hypothetical protein